MTTAYTSLLGLALPVTGELSGTWGDTVNNAITSLLDSAVAGTTTISSDADVTLTTTTGAANTSREAILLWTAGGTVTRTITAPAQSKTYIVINKSSSTQSIKLVGVGPTTGVTIALNEKAVCAWNGSDFVKVSSTVITNLTGTLPATNGGTDQSSYAVGDLLYASTTTALSKLADVATGNALISGGVSTAPSWGKIGLATHVSGTLPVANGGTGQTTYTDGQLLIGNSTGNTLAKATLTAGSGISITNGAGSISIAASGGSSTLTISNKTAAYTVVAGDLDTVINCTSGTFTVSLTAAATLGSGFNVVIWNTSTTAADAITIDPATTETIDGVATLILRPGEGMQIVCNGTNWSTGNKKVMRAYAENINDSTLARPIASQARSIAIGIGANSSGIGAIGIGYNSVSSNDYSLALGAGATAAAGYSVAIGGNSTTTGAQTATGVGAMALGTSYASGSDSFAAAITDNTSSYGATGTRSIAMGRLAIASTSFATALGGATNTASGNYSGVLSGATNTASGQSAVTLGGESNTASGLNSAVIGGRYGSTRSIIGYIASGAGDSPIATTLGVSQLGMLVLGRQTTDATATVLTSNTAAAAATNQITLPNNSAYYFRGEVIAGVTAGGNTKGWFFEGVIKRGANAAATSLVGTPTVTSNYADAGASAWTVAITANTTLGCITITVTGQATTTIRWVAQVRTTEMTY